MAVGTPGARIDPSSEKPVRGAFHDPAVLRTFFVDFENEDWEAELEAFHRTDVEVPATVRVDGQTLQQVGLHFRGMSSYMMVPRGSKRSLNMSFAEWIGTQAVQGVRTTNLLNSNGDPTFIRAALYSHIARQYIPAPRVNWARVVVNGEDWGLYLNQQQFNREMLVEQFHTTSGARWHAPGSPMGRAGLEYLGDDAAPYRERFELKTKDSPERWAALIKLAKLLNTTEPAKLEQALRGVLDVDGALKFLALEVVLLNSDGYWSRASDYSLFEDSTGVFHLVPHDMNEPFETGGPGGGPGGRTAGGPPGGMLMMGGGGVKLDPLVGLTDASKPLRSKLLAVPALRARYLAYVRDIATTWLDWTHVGPLVTQWRTTIEPVVKADTRKLFPTDRFAPGVDELHELMSARRTWLLQRLTELGA